MRDQIEAIYQRESRRIFATLVRLLGDFDLAEDVLQEAFIVALQRWPIEGIPDSPRAWLVSTARFKGIDRMRRQSRFKDLAETKLAGTMEAREPGVEEAIEDTQQISDDQLRLIFTCCHPALNAATRVALTLREVCGLTTEEVAGAFLLAPATLAQRLVRGKAKIKAARIPYEVPAPEDLHARLDAVLAVIYLVFNEGYNASSGPQLTRSELSAEAIRLARQLLDLLPNPEVMSLLALMLLQESRREARCTAEGDIVLLDEQDRSLWNREQIDEGKALLEQVTQTGQMGTYTLQAAIAAVHAGAETAQATDWKRILTLYDLLVQLAPSPVVELNRAVAVAMVEGAAAGLQLVDELLQAGELKNYYLVHAARADLCRRLGNTEPARESYRRALELARQEPERAFLRKRLGRL
ncbi:MAG: RNA polymerase sigma factor [Pseudohongiellaceae bacterium]